MSGHGMIEFLKHLNILSLSVLIGILLTSVLFPLQPIVQQALVGILMVWFGVIIMLGFPLRR